MLSLFDVVDARENDDVRDGPGIPTKESSTLGGIEWNGMKLKLNHTDCLIKFDNLQFFCDYLFNQLIPIERLKHKYSMFFLNQLKVITFHR